MKKLRLKCAAGLQQCVGLIDSIFKIADETTELTLTKVAVRPRPELILGVIRCWDFDHSSVPA